MPDYDSIRIYPKTKSAISKLSKKWEMTQVNFLQSAMIYFQNTGVNPKDDKVLSPAEELKKFRDTIIGFMRKQEKDYILPVFGNMQTLIVRFQKYLDEEAPRKIGSEQGDYSEFSGSRNIENQSKSIEDKTEKSVESKGEDFKNIENDLLREREKLKTVKTYFEKVIKSIEKKSTGMQKKLVVELPLAEIKDMEDYLKRL